MYLRRELSRWRGYLVGKRNLLRKRVLRRKRNPLKRCDLQIIHDLLQTFTDQLLKHLPAMISLINPMLHFLVCYELLEIRTAVNFLDLYILGILYRILVWYFLLFLTSLLFVAARVIFCLSKLRRYYFKLLELNCQNIDVNPDSFL